TVQPTCLVATGSITVTAPLGAGLEYSIDGTNYQTGITFNGLAVNNYNLTVRNAQGCVSLATAVTIDAQPSTPVAPTATTVQPTCLVATGSITVTAPTGAGLEYSIDGTNYQAGVTFSGLPSAAYNLTVRNAQGCVSLVTAVTIDAQPATPAAPTATTVQPTCLVATGSITVTAPTGAGLEYSIDGTNYQAGTTFNGLAANNYNLTVRNAQGCVSLATAVTIDAQPSTPVAPTATTVQPTCLVATGSITVTSPTGAGLEYSIDGANYQAGVTFTGLASNNYNLTVRNAQGCVSLSTAVTIDIQPTTPTAPTATTVQPTCLVATGSITVTAPLGAGLEYSIDGTNYQTGITFNGLAVNNYNLTVRNAQGCVSLATAVTIDAQPSTPVAPTATTVQPTCLVATGSITVTAPTGAGLEYSIDGTNYQAGLTFNGLTSATYTLTVRNAQGCVSLSTAVTIDAQPSTPTAPTATTVQPTCLVTTGSITVTAPVGAGLEYSIDGTNYQAGVTFNGLAANNYNLTVRNSQGCVSTGTSVTIDAQPATPLAPTVSTVQPTCLVATGSITVTAPLGAGLEYSIDGTNYQTGITFNGLAANNYNLTVRNAQGCVSLATTVTIDIQPSTPVAPTASTVQPTCLVATGSITVTAPLGAGLEYSIDGANYQAGVTFTGLASNNYNLTVRNAQGCVSLSTAVTIDIQPTTPTAPTATTVQPTCLVATGSITVASPTGAGLEYSIDGTNYQSGVTFTGLAANNYNLTVRNAQGCVSLATTVTIDIQPATPAVPTATTVQPTCLVANGSITVTAPIGAGLEYSIDGANYQAGTTFNGLTSTTYTLTVRNAQGCVSTGTSVTIDAQPATPLAPTVSTVQPTCLVATGSITVTSPTGAGLEYSIDGTNYQAGTTFNGLAANNYNLTVRNAQGCVSLATTVTIDIQPSTPVAPTASTVQPTCLVATGSITVTSPTGAGLEYSIDGANYQAGVTFNGLTSTTYTLIVRNAQGCVSTATSVTINTQPATPAAPTATTVQPTCLLPTGSITVTSPTGAGLEYSIDGTNYQAGLTFNGLAANNYNLTVRNAQGCVSLATTVTIDIQPSTPVAPTASTVQPTCLVAIGSITVTAPLGAGLEYSIDGTNYQAGLTFTGLTSTTYNLTVRNAQGCVSTATSVTIDAQPATPAAPTVTTVQPTCLVATGSITVTSPTGAGLEYSIDGTNYQAGTTFNGLAANNYNLTVRNAQGCVSLATTVTIDIQPSTPVAPTASTVQPTCFVATGSITVTAPLGAGLEYSIDGANYQAGVTFTGLASNNYNLTVRNAQGCVSTATSITINTQPATPATPTATTLQPTCLVATGSITVTSPTGAGLEYSIDGTNYQAGTTFNGLASNNYNLTVRNAQGCVSLATAITIDAQPATPAVPTATTVQPTCLVTTGSITVTAPIGAGLEYSIDGSNYQAGVTFTGLAANNYNLTVRNAQGCVLLATAVTIDAQPSTPAAPTATTVQPTCLVATGSITVTAPLGAGLEYSIDGTNYQAGTVFNGLTSTTYTLTVRNAQGCVSTVTSVTIDAQPATPAAPTATTVQSTCLVATGSITVTSPTGAGLEYSIDGTNYQAGTTFNGLASNNYNLTVRNAQGCVSTGTSVTIDAQPATPAAPTATTVQPTCLVATGSITVTAPLGAGLEYSIDGTNYQAGLTFTGLTSTTYNLTVRNAQGCVSTVTSVTIDAQPATPAAPTASTVQPTCLLATGSITVTAPLGAGLEYSIDGTNYQSGLTFNGLTSTTYNLTVRNAQGCVSLATVVTIDIQPSTPAAPMASTVQPTCLVATGSITVASPIGAGLEYSIDGTNYQAGPTFNGLAANNYNLTVRNAQGCVSLATTVTIDIQPSTPVAPTASTVQPTCLVATGSITVTAPVGAGLEYSIDGTNYQSGLTFNGLTATNYNLTVRNAQGCVSTATTVTIDAQPTTPSTPTYLIVQPTCLVSTAILTVTSPLNLEYSIDGVNYQSGVIFSNLSTGSYSLTARNTDGCISQVTTVTVNSPLLSPAIPQVNIIQPLCFGEVGEAHVISPLGIGLTYSIDGTNYQISPDFGNLAAGSYNISVKNLDGCISPANSVTIDAAPSAINLAQTHINPACNQSTGSIDISVSGGIAPYSYSWNNGQAIEDISNLAAGTYTLTVTDVNNCSQLINVDLSDQNGPVVTVLGQTNNLCNGLSSGSINIDATGVGPLNYTWSGPNGFNAVTEDISNLSGGTYTLTVTDANNCQASTSVVIAEPPVLTLSEVHADAACNLATGVIDVTVTGGTPPYSYNWSSGENSEDISNKTAGSYTLIVTDANNCSQNITVNLNEQSGPVITVDNQINVTCFGDSNGAIDITASGTGTLTYSWTGPNGFNTAAEDLAGLVAGTYNLTVTDLNNCSATASVIIAEPQTLILSEIHTNATCSQATGAINVAITGGTAPYSYNWNNGKSTESISSEPPGSYTLTVTDANNCSQSITVILNDETGPSITVDTQTNVSCNGGDDGAINVTVTGGTAPYSYSWSNGQATEDISGLSQGTYTLTVTDANNCEVTASVTLTEPQAISLSETHTNPACNQSTGAIDVSVAGGTAPFTYSWSSGEATEDLSGKAAGSYTLTVTDANNCSENIAVTLNDVAGPSITVDNQTNISCNGGTNGAINVTVSSGTAPYTYSWSGGQATEDIATLVAGTYILTVTDANNCQATASVTLTEPLAISLSETHTNPACNQSTGAIDVSVVGGTAPYSYSWSSGEATEDLSGKAAGSYTLTVTDANNCSENIAVTLNDVAGPSITVDNQTNVSCNGASDGAINVTVSGGTAPYNYSWSSGQAIEDLTGLSQGTYTLTVTDANNCQATANVTLTEPLALVLSEAHTDPTCNLSNGSIDISVVGGTAPYTYSWLSGQAIEDLSAIAAGSYTLTVTDANNCSKNITVTLNDVAGPAITVDNQTNVSCNGASDGAINVTVTGGTAPYSYSWSSGQAIEDLTGLSQGTYTLTVTDANNCQATASVTLTEPLALVLSEAHIDPTCNLSNGSIDITISGGTAPYTYSWSSGQAIEDLSAIAAGSYTLTVTDANNCSKNITVTLNDLAGPSVTVDNQTNVSCNGASDGAINVTITGGTAPFSYSWSSGQATEDLTGLSQGTYTLTVTDANNCQATASVTLTEPLALVLSEAHTDPTCNLSNGSIDISVVGGTAPYTYSWSSGQAIEDLSAIAAGSYTLTVTDANNCAKNITVTLNDVAGPSITVDNQTNVSCNGASDGAINVTVSGGTAPYNYSWSSGQATEDLTGLSQGTYTLTVTDANNCQATTSVTLTEPLVISLSETHTEPACNQSTGTIDVSVAGGTAPFSYAWSSGETTEDLSGKAAGSFTLTVTDANNCAKNITVTLNDVAGPSITVDNQTNASCNGAADGVINVTITGGTAPFSYSWSSGQAIEDLTGLSQGAYTLTVTDANNCQATASVTLTEPLALVLSEAHTDPTCNLSNGSIDISVVGGTAPFTYVWSNGEATEDLSAIASGNYTLTVTDANNCVQSITVNLNDQNGPAITVDNQTNVSCNGGANGAINVTISGGTAPFSYSWSSGQATEDLAGLSQGAYTLTVTDANNCQATASVTLTEPLALVLSEVHTDPTCNLSNGSIDISVVGGTAPYTYVWSNGEATEDLSAIASGNYTLTVTDANNCVQSITVNLNDQNGPAITVDNQTNVSCNGGANGAINVTISGGTAPFSYSWSSGQATEDLTGLSQGAYILTVTDANNCQATASVTLTEPLALVLSEVHTDPTCNLSNGSIDISVVGGTAPYTYAWSSGETTEDLSGKAAGSYTLIVTDANNCVQSITVNLNDQNGPSITVDNQTNASCNGASDGAINVTVSGGTAPFSYSWSSGQATEDLTGLSQGTYILTV
ncbi:hypothetical protein C3K47_19190, partial [Solitalea longa]